MLKSGCFTVSIGDAAHTTACDYVGIVSGNKDPEKTAKAGFTPIKSENVNAPYFAELPMALECKLISFDEKVGCTVGEIVNINADGSILDSEGKISLENFSPICYDPVSHNYVAMGKTVGKAFSDGKKLCTEKE